MKFIKKLLLNLYFGFRLENRNGRHASNLERCILVCIHTANDEYILGNLAYWVLDKKLKVIIKDAHTKAWYPVYRKRIGQVGIDRSQRNNLVKFVVDEFKR